MHLPRWIIASVMLVPLALALASFFPYPQGRSLFVIPALGLSLVGTAALLICHGLRHSWARLRHTTILIGLSTAMIALIAANIAVLHPDLASLGNIKAIITLALGFNVFLLTSLIASIAPDLAYRRITLCTALLLGVLAAQIIFSYLTGWGEIYDQNDGARRAYGMAGDGFTLLLSFGCLWAIMGQRVFLSALTGAALLMTGGRLALLSLLLCFVLYSPFLWQLGKSHTRTLILFVIKFFALCLIISSTADMVRSPNEYNRNQVPASAVRLSNIKELRTANVALPWHLRTLNHYYYGAFATGSGRLIGLGAGLQMLQDNPLSGVGYGNSTAVMNAYAAQDFFALKDKINISADRFTSERLIANQTATIAAETGWPGLALFIGMCAAALWIAVHSYLSILRQTHPLSSQDQLVLACSIWAMVLIVGNQTATWFLPASPNLLWLYICLGLCATHLASKARA